MSNVQDGMTDLELVEEVRNGRREAFTELMRRHQQRVYWFVRKIVRTHEDADDVTQETFVKAYLNLGEFRGDASFFTWVYRIALNGALNAVRKRQVVNYVRENDLINRFFPSGDDPHRELVQKELETHLQQAVANLPEKQRAVFILRYFEELSYEEISAILKTSVGGLKANYFHALRKVQEALRHEVQIPQS
jgi:RNA polymerase sigma-70 factor (ECF subfamily)